MTQPRPTSGTATPTAGAPQDTAFFGHPRGLSTLCFTELWERFSYYGIRAILILLMPHCAGKATVGTRLVIPDRRS